MAYVADALPSSGLEATLSARTLDCDGIIHGMRRNSQIFGMEALEDLGKKGPNRRMQSVLDMSMTVCLKKPDCCQFGPDTEFGHADRI